MIDHSGHPHPSTPAARALCRANGGTGNISKPGGGDAPKSRKVASVKKKAPRPIVNIDTGKAISRDEAAARMFGTQRAKALTKARPKTNTPKRAPALTDPKIPVAKVKSQPSTDRPALIGVPLGVTNVTPRDKYQSLRNDPAYVKDYERGYRAGRGKNDLSAADKRSESEAFYDGFSDRSIGAEKWTATEERAGVIRFEKPTNFGISTSVKSMVEKSTQLGGGAIASTDKVKFRNGKEGIRKRTFTLSDDIQQAMIDDGVDPKTIHGGKKQNDAEELASMVGRMMGLSAPQVYRFDDSTVYMELMPGKIAATQGEAGRKKLASTEQGLMIGLFDEVIGNADRNDGNWLVDDQGNIHLIDHGFAWSAETKRRGKDHFANRIGLSVARDSLKRTDISPQDLDSMAEIINTLKPEFEKRGNPEWAEYSLQRIEALRPYAKGTKQRIRGAQ